MNKDIERILSQITVLEDELITALQEQQEEIHFFIEGRKVRFEKTIRDTHRKLKIGLFRWFRQSESRNALSAPFIYGMIAPFVLMDACVTLYQAICFPLYRIPQVNRRNYVIIDRHHLNYLNFMEKLNCVYCGYGNGVIAYVREIAARTEQYWCPIKHARKIIAPHRRYVQFADYGIAGDYQELRQRLRQELRQEPEDEIR